MVSYIALVRSVRVDNNRELLENKKRKKQLRLNNSEIRTLNKKSNLTQ